MAACRFVTLGIASLLALAPASVAAEPAAAVPPSTRRVAVVVFNFASDPQVPRAMTTTQARNAFFDGPTSLHAFWQRESKNTRGFTGDVLFRTLPSSWTPPDAAPVSFNMRTCNHGAWDVYLQTQLDYSAYDHVTIISPSGMPCAYPGLGAMGSRDNIGKVSWFFGTPSTPSVRHEFGHNFGLYHSTNLRCTANGAKVIMSSTCAVPADGNDQQDSYDPMGWGPCSYSTWNRAYIGMPVDVLEPTTDGLYRIRATDLAANGTPDTLRLPRVADEWGDAYQIEWTSETFPECSSAHVDGIQIRVVPPADRDNRTTYLLDGTPETEWVGDATMPAGRMFTDPVAGFAVTLERIDAGAAEIRVAGFPRPGVVSLTAGVLKIAARDGERNNIDITQTATTITVTDKRPIAPGAGCTKVSSRSVSCPRSEVTRIDVFAGDGNDVVAPSVSVPVDIYGGDGDDRLQAGATADGPTRFRGGAGIDHVNYGTRTNAVNVKIDARAGDGEVGERDRVDPDVENITTGSGDDLVKAGNGVNTIAAGTGVDTIKAGGGDDVVNAVDATRDERVDCGPGIDRVSYDRPLDTPIGCE